MRVKFIIITLLILPFILKCEKEDKNDNIIELKKSCINAAIIGIELDIERHLIWLENYSKDTFEINARLIVLEENLTKYQNLLSHPDSYQLPEKYELAEAWINTTCQENISLQFTGQTRSGPFYHISGIKDNDYEAIHPDKIYYVVLYPVYTRYYPFQDSYIYIHKLWYIKEKE